MTEFFDWLNSVLPPLSNVWWDLVLALGIFAVPITGATLLLLDDEKK